MSEFNLPPIVSSRTSLQEAISLMSSADTDYLLAVDGGQLVGWLTAKDVVKLVALGRINEDCNLEAVMTQPYHVLNPEEAENLPLVWLYFQNYQVLQLPVVSAEGEFLGLVTAQEVIKSQAKYVEVLKQQFNNSSLAQTESSYLLKEITSFYPGIIYIYDLERQCIVYNGESMAGFLGYTKEEIRSRGNEILTNTIHPEDVAQIDSRMAEVELLADGEIKQFEYRAYAVDGNVRWLQNDLRVFRRKPDGKAKLLVGFVQDISDRKVAEAELQKKRLELEAVFMAMPDLWMSVDNNGVCLEFYSAPEQELYKPVNQVIGKKITEVLPDYLAKEVLATIQQVLTIKEIATIEYELEVPSGLQFYECKIIPLTDNQILSIARNITDRKNMEKLLRQSNAELEVKVLERTQSLWKANVKLAHQIEEKNKLTEALNQSEILFRSIFEQAAVGIVICNENGQIIQSNQKFCQIIGYDEHELLTMTWMDLTHPDSMDTSLAMCKKITKTNKNGSIERKNICKDGSSIWVNVTVSRIEEIFDKKAYDVAIIEDINDRKQVEVALRKSEDKFQKMVANIPGMVYQFRQDVTGSYSFDYASTFCQQLYGVPAIELIRNVNIIFDCNHPEENEKLHQSIVQSAETMQPWNYLGRVIDIFGKIKWIEGISHPERQENGDILWNGILMDVTDRQLAQEQIRTALHEKELLLKEIHHRVKNNLQIIISLLSLQSQYMQDQSSISLFQESQNRVYSMALIHEQLYQSTSLDRVNFAEYINILVSHLQQSYFLRRPIELKVTIAEVFLSIETAVPCGLIINELVANALKYAFPEDQPDISRLDHPLITVEFRQIDGKRFSLSVKDNGIGISTNIDLDNLSTLGLSLVQMLTQQLEGQLALHSQQGTECTIIFSELSYDQRV
jgi:PAS domain S-box-containing protein